MPSILRWSLVVVALGLVAGHAQAATLIVATDRDPDSLDPAQAYASESWQVLVNAGEGLVAYRRAGGTAGTQVVPALAEAMPAVSDGGRRLTFTLRRDARFGAPANRAVRPSDVKASLERLFVARSPGRALYRPIRGSEAFERTGTGGISGIVARDSTRQLEISLTRSDPSILQVLALPFAFVVPRGTPASDQSTAGIASAGPYRIDDYTPGRSIDLVANAGYRAGAAGPALAGPERIRVAIGEERGAADRAGIDYQQRRPTRDEVVAARRVGVRVARRVEGSTHYFFMNTRRAPFDDIRVRRAVNMAIDRRALARAFEGAAVPTAQVLPPGTPGYRRVSVAAPRVAAARALVAKAGKLGARVTVWGPTNEPSPMVTRMLERTLTQIGLRPQRRLWERSSLLAALADPSVGSQIGYVRWQQDYPDGADWFPQLLSGDAVRAGANRNYSLLTDSRLDRRIAAAGALWNPTARAAAWAQVDRSVRARAAWAPFANSVRTDIVSRRVGDYVSSPVYGFLWMRAQLADTRK